jgi:hypothetical protein
VPAHGLDLLGDVAGAAALGALERHVLEEMREAVDLRRLVAGADANPDAQGHGFDPLHGLADHAQAVGQRADPDAHAETRPARARM